MFRPEVETLIPRSSNPNELIRIPTKSKSILLIRAFTTLKYIPERSGGRINLLAINDMYYVTMRKSGAKRVLYLCSIMKRGD